MNAKEIVIDYLKKNGFDGLCADQCGCSIDDLAPCCSLNCDCNPGYSHAPPDCESCDDKCDGYIGGSNIEFCIKPYKPASQPTNCENGGR